MVGMANLNSESNSIEHEDQNSDNNQHKNNNETPKLSLIKPNWATDEIAYTLESLADNFDKIDEVLAPNYADAPPNTGTWQAKHMIHNDKPDIGQYVGWVNVRTGAAAPLWSELTRYNNGDQVVPARDNGHVYICKQSGHSGLTEPIFPVSEKGQVQDIRGAGMWRTNEFYEINDLVFPSLENGFFYVCIQAGESGDIEPNWSIVEGSTTYDYNTSWHGYRIAVWEEHGAAALFRPFGKIE